MKTIKQIADEIGVSKQAIHQKIKKEPLSTKLTPLTSTVDRVIYISVDGEKLIKSAFIEKLSSTIDASLTSTVDVNKSSDVDDENPAKSAFIKKTTSTVDVNESSTVDAPINNQIITILQENLKLLQSQLAEKDKQIAELIATNKAHAQSINADRHVELANKLQESPVLIEDSSTKPRFKERLKFLFKGEI